MNQSFLTFEQAMEWMQQPTLGSSTQRDSPQTTGFPAVLRRLLHESLWTAQIAMSSTERMITRHVHVYSPAPITCTQTPHAKLKVGHDSDSWESETGCAPRSHDVIRHAECRSGI